MASAGIVTFVIRGDWVSGTVNYKIFNLVYYGGSTYIAKNNISNSTVPPENDSLNWQLFAHGYMSDLLSEINGIDTSGLLGTVGATVPGQSLIDEIADMVSSKLLPIDNIANNQSTNISGFALDARQANPDITNSLSYKINKLSTKLGGSNCLIIADSYYTWINTFETYYSGTVYRSVLGGAGFMGAGQGKTFGNLLTDSSNVVPDPNIIDTIIVQGFLNDDNQNRTAVVNAGGTFITNCNNMYPNAKIHFVNAGWSTDPLKQASLVLNVEPTISEIANFATYPIYYHNVQHISHYYPNFVDAYHQNSSGYRHLAIAILNAINGCEYSCPFVQDNSVLTATSNASGITGTISNVMQGKNILINPFEITFTCNLARSVGQTLDILTLSGGFVIGNTAGGNIQMQGTLNNYACDIYISNGVLLFSVPISMTTGTSYTLKSRGVTVPYFKG